MMTLNKPYEIFWLIKKSFFEFLYYNLLKKSVCKCKKTKKNCDISFEEFVTKTHMEDDIYWVKSAQVGRRGLTFKLEKTIT